MNIGIGSRFTDDSAMRVNNGETRISSSNPIYLVGLDGWQSTLTSGTWYEGQKWDAYHLPSAFDGYVVVPTSSIMSSQKTVKAIEFFLAADNWTPSDYFYVDDIYTIAKPAAPYAAFSQSMAGPFTYNGSAFKPVITAGSNTGVGAVTNYYYTDQSGNAVASPTNVGTYNIYISCNAGSLYTAQTNRYLTNFVIQKATPSAADFNEFSQTLTYDGNNHAAGVTIKSPRTGMGTWSVFYKNQAGTGNTSTPNGAGTYQVWVTVTGTGSNYNSNTTGFRVGTMVINRAGINKNYINYTLTNYTYDGNPKSASASVKSSYSGIGSVTAIKYKPSGGTASTTEPTNVNTYEVLVDVSAGSNYNGAMDLSLGSFTINPRANTPSDLNYGNSTVTYDGNNKSVSVTNKTSNIGAITVTYKLDGTGSNVTPNGAGTYYVYASVAAFGNYSGMGTTHVAYLYINRAGINKNYISYTLTNYTYDGTQKSVDASVKSGYSGIGSVTAIKYKPSGGTASTTEPTNVNTYEVLVDVSAGSNHNGATELSLGSFTINQAKYPENAVTYTAPTLVYNTLSQETAIKAPVTKNHADIATMGVTVAPKAGGTGNAAMINAGEYTLTVTLSGNANYENKTFTFAASIGKADYAENAVTVSPTELVYTGASRGEDFKKGITDNLPTGTTATTTIYLGTTVTDPVVVNTYTLKVAATGNSNYNDHTFEFAIAITKADTLVAHLDFTENQSTPYANSVRAFAYSRNREDIGTVHLYYKLNNTGDDTTGPINAGTYTVYAVIDGNANFNGLARTKIGTLEITKINYPEGTLTYVMPTETDRTYTGGSKADVIKDGIKVNSPATGYTNATIKNSASTAVAAPTEVDTYSLTVMATGNSNYNDTPFTFTGIEIIKAPIFTDIHLTWSVPADYDYNGTAQSATATTNTTQYPGMGTTATLYYVYGTTEYTEAQPDGGTYRVLVSVPATNNYEGLDKVELGQYTVKRIAPTSAQLQAVAESFVYDGQPKSVSVSAATGVTGMGGITVSYKRGEAAAPAPTNAGSYSVYVAIDDTGRNYREAADLLAGTLTITPAPVTKLDLDYDESTSQRYTGASQRVTVGKLTTGIGDITLTFKQNNTEIDPVVVGEYEVWVGVAASQDGNYQAMASEKIATLIITPALFDQRYVIVTAEDCVYDTYPHAATARPADGVSGLGAISLTYQVGDSAPVATAPKNADEYTVLVFVEPGDNYEGSGTAYPATSFTISRAAFNLNLVTYTPPANTVYDETPKTAQVNPKPAVEGLGGITVSYKDETGNPVVAPTEPGTYTVYIEVEDDGQNYEGTTAPVSDNWTFAITVDTISVNGTVVVGLQYAYNGEGGTMVSIPSNGAFTARFEPSHLMSNLTFEFSPALPAGTRIVLMDRSTADTPGQEKVYYHILEEATAELPLSVFASMMDESAYTVSDTVAGDENSKIAFHLCVSLPENATDSSDLGVSVKNGTGEESNLTIKRTTYTAGSVTLDTPASTTGTLTVPATVTVGTQAEPSVLAVELLDSEGNAIPLPVGAAIKLGDAQPAAFGNTRFIFSQITSADYDVTVTGLPTGTYGLRAYLCAPESAQYPMADQQDDDAATAVSVTAEVTHVVRAVISGDSGQVIDRINGPATLSVTVTTLGTADGITATVESGVDNAYTEAADAGITVVKADDGTYTVSVSADTAEGAYRIAFTYGTATDYFYFLVIA